jgi:hypothetical protein
MKVQVEIAMVVEPKPSVGTQRLDDVQFKEPCRGAQNK